MWPGVSLLCLTLLSCLCHGRGQEQASLSKVSDPAGHCLYTFTVARPEEASCPGGSSSGEETEKVLARLTLLEAVVSGLVAAGAKAGDVGTEGLQEAHARVTRERNQMQEEQKRMNRQVQELQSKLLQLSQEADGLRTSRCPQTGSTGGGQNDNRPISDPAYDPGTYREMKAEVVTVSSAQLSPEGNLSLAGCGELVSVEDPVLHRTADSITGKYGVWLQDPEPQGPVYTNRTVWRLDAVSRDVRQLFAYEDLDQFSRGSFMKLLVLPEPVESTGATLYRGSLYYQRRRSRTLLRYDLSSERVAARRDLPHAGFHGQHPYSWGGYTDIDLAADERGLWAIYSTEKAKGAIVISLLDPRSLEVRRSWETRIRKNTVANAFMACGRLYTVASYAAANTTINYTFDTATGEGRAVAVPFKNKYQYNSMVDYNHAQRRLFAWDHFHMVTYDVRLGGAGAGAS
ncbi:myocilin-like [Cololabis saira]|uniref:myocilin-like n=1 Tax=Cololabis saira TaxID=129043 RepID=UPI002AD2990B|nr:myocilin-like [Cololabis saira]